MLPLVGHKEERQIEQWFAVLSVGEPQAAVVCLTTSTDNAINRLKLFNKIASKDVRGTRESLISGEWRAYNFLNKHFKNLSSKIYLLNVKVINQE